MAPFPQFILIPVLSLLPCVLWLWYFYSKSVYKRPPLRLIAGTFLLGSVSTVLALALNLLGQSFFLSLLGRSQLSHILVLFFVVGPIEELVKLLVVYVYAYRQPEFDEPLDGVIYATAAGLGFAAVENVIYLSQNSPLLVLLRGPLSNPGHALFSSLWGLSLSQAKAAPNITRQRLPIIARGWLMASVLHASFDTLLLAVSENVRLIFPLLLVAMLALFIWVRGRIRFHSETSPHREGTLQLQAVTYCLQCGERGRAGEPCASCGAVVPQSGEVRLCSVCSSLQRPGASFCSRCGANLALPANENLHSRPHFVAVSSDGDERIAYILNRQEILIGRTLNNAFVIANPSVSKRHARVVAKNGSYALYDLGSSNGTFINGKRVIEAELQDGCEVRFGRATFVFRAHRGRRVEITDAHR